MATPFDSFNRSALDAFVQSPLQARGSSGATFNRTVALQFGISTTPTIVKYPQFSPYVPSTKYVRIYKLVSGSIVLDQQFTLGGGGDLSIGSFYDSANETWRIERQRAGAVLVPSNAPPGAFWRVRVNASAGYNSPAEVHMTLFPAVSTFDGFASGTFLGLAFPGIDNRFDPGPLVPGQRYLFFFKVQNDLSFAPRRSISGRRTMESRCVWRPTCDSPRLAWTIFLEALSRRHAHRRACVSQRRRQ